MAFRKNNINEKSVSEQQLALEIQKAADDAQIPATFLTNYEEFEKSVAGNEQ